MFTKFYEALKKDAQAVKEAEEKAYKQYPDSPDPETQAKNVAARNNMISTARQYPASTAVRREIYYTMKNTTEDFLKKVYDSDHKQDVKPFTVPEDLEEVSVIEDEALSLVDYIRESDNDTVESDDTKNSNEKIDDNNKDLDENANKQPNDEKDMPPEETPIVPDDSKDATEKEKKDDLDGKQQDDPTNATGPEPDPNPDSVKTPAVVLPT